MRSRLLIALGTLVVTTAIPLQAAQAATPEVISSLISQDQYVAGVENSLIHFSVALSGRDAASTAATKLVITSYKPIHTRQEVRDASTGELPSTVDTVIIDVSQVRDPATGRVDVAVPIEIGRRTKEALQMSATGVYPISIGLQEGKSVTSQIVTFVERLPQEVTSPLPSENLRIALVGTLTSEVSLQSDGSTLISDASRELLSNAITTLEANPQTAVSLAVRPELMDALANSSEADIAVLSRLQAATSLHLLASTYVDVQPDELVASQNSDVFTSQLRLGEDTMASIFPTKIVSRDSWLESSALSSNGAQLLRDLGLRTAVLLSESQKTTAGGISLFAEPTRLFELKLSNSDRMTAALADIHLGEALTRGSNEPNGGAYLVAQQILAELKVLRIEIVDRDETMNGRGVILSTESGVLPSTALTTALVNSIAGQPDMSFVSLEDLLNTMTVSLMDGLPVSVELQALEDPNPADTALKDFAARVNGFSAMLPDGDERPTHWRRVISVLPSRSLTQVQVKAYINAVDTELAAIGGSVVTPTSTIFTLGGRDSSIRLSLRNDNDTDLLVRVHLTSSKLTLPKDDQVVTLPAGTTTLVEIPVTAKSNGRFPVTLQLLTPNGDVTVGTPATFSARVNALAGLGQLFTGIALLLLLSWWIHHLRREHQRRQFESFDSTERHPSGERSA
ncbi:MAG: hypothetical protein GM46_2775 [actinobacterium acAcidi]|nr:MAG: hypothetical protein GM46_2775 [actinobacterium acAcidi]